MYHYILVPPCDPRWFNVTFSEFLLVVSKRFRYTCDSDTKLSSPGGRCQKHFEASQRTPGFSRTAARDTRDRTDKPFRRGRNSVGEDDRIKFPAARDAELSYGFVRELIMFRNRRPGDRERTVYAWWTRTTRDDTKEGERGRGEGEGAGKREKEWLRRAKRVRTRE